MDLNLASPLPPAPHINRCAASEIQFDALYQFLRSQYRTDSFEGRNGSVWGSDYSKGLTEHHLDKLHLNGFSSIPANASASGAVVWFDGQLAVRDVRFYSAIAAQRAAESRSFVA